MRYYTKTELSSVLANWNNYWKTDNEDSKNYPDIFIEDLEKVALATNKDKTKSVYYKIFAENYPLNIGDYFKTNRTLVGVSEMNTSDDKRFPIILVYTDSEGIPDMSVLTEYGTLKTQKDTEGFKVIVLDKMNKPVKTEILEGMAKDLGVTYKPEIYGAADEDEL